MKKIILLVLCVALGMVTMVAQTTNPKDQLIKTLQDAQEVLDEQNTLYSKPMRTGQELYTHCYEESLDVRGESMGGFGIAEGHLDRATAKEEANKNAIDDIASRYVGVVNNGIQKYYASSKDSDGNKNYESELKAQTTVIGENVINKYAEQVCFKYEKDANGMYTCYVAVQIPLDILVEKTMEEMSTILPEDAKSPYEIWLKAELDKLGQTTEQ